MSSGTAVYKSGQKLFVVHVGGNGLAVARFVVALIAVIALAAGAAIVGQSWVGGGVALAISVFAICLFRLFGKMRAKKLSRMPTELPRYVTIDLEEQEVRDYQGELLGPLAAARMEMVFQATSSSKAVALMLPGTKMVIARGNPFVGDTYAVVDALARHGVRGP